MDVNEGMLMRIVIVLLSLLATTEAAEESWWQFLGPNGNGHTASSDLPTNWTEHENVAWKTAIHDRGWSSPVVAENQIWITTATPGGHKLFAVCVDRNSGKVGKWKMSGSGAPGSRGFGQK